MEYSFVAKLLLDKSAFDSGIDSASKEASSKIGGLSKVGDAVKKGLGVAAKVGAAAITAASGAVVALTKSAVDGFAEYEQLVGGVETLFGESAQKVIDDASNAFRTAGMSMNDYMETSIQSAASLINALDGDQAKAADLMNMSITDMADNVNKMGTTMEAVQNAYRGFSRGNFTMLDNLALGFAGTKEGMQELLNKAEEISGVKFDISSYADIVKAIHVVQDEMGITGTTAKEASETISGSLSSLKSAWSNLVTGFADPNANLGTLVNDVVNAATTALGNLMPAAESAIEGIAVAVDKIAPIIVERLPWLVETVLPPILNADTSLVNAVVASLPEITKVLINQAPTIIDTLVNVLVDMSPELVELGFALIVALIQGITKSLPELMAKAPEIVKTIAKAIIDNAPQMLIATAQLIATFLVGMGEWMRPLVQKGKEVVNTIKDGFMQKVNDAKNWGKDLIQNFINGILGKLNALKDTVRKTAQTVKNFLGFSEPKEGPLSDFHTFAPDMMRLFAEGIRKNEDIITNQIAKSFDFSDAMSFSSPTRVASTYRNAERESPITIVVQSVLDGRVIGETAYKYNLSRARAVGG